MPLFFIDIDGEERDRLGREFATVADARNEAVATLGAHLQRHPDFASQAHWRVDVRDQGGRLLLHVIVATVDAARPLNLASFGG